MEVADAKRLLEEENKARIEECSKELQELLKEHSCELDAQMVLSPGKAPSLVLRVVAL